MYISKIIAEDLVNWQDSTQVFISAPTGSGKTYFVLNSLLPYALTMGREILYFSNRQILHQQLVNAACEMFGVEYQKMRDEKIAEFPGITFTTYQAWQEKLNHCVDVKDDPYYFYMVLDEVHYFVADGYFNAESYKLFEWLPEMHVSVRIAISATIEEGLPYFDFYSTEWHIVEETAERQIAYRRSRKILDVLRGWYEYRFFYDIKMEQPRYRICVYDDVDDIVEEINNDQTEDKWLVFQSNKERAAKNLQKRLEKAAVFISADNKEGEVVEQIVREQKFESQVLITTKVLDNGVSLHDERIRKIVMDTVDKTEFLQMLGRRRSCGENDELCLYLPRYSKKYFAWLLNANINPALTVMSKPEDDLMNELLKNKGLYEIVCRYCFIEDGRLRKNRTAKRALSEQAKKFHRILTLLDEDSDAFLKIQLGWLGIDSSEVEMIDLKQRRWESTYKMLSGFVTRYIGITLGKEKQREFRTEVQKFFKVLLEKVDARVPGINKINSNLETLEIPFEIVSQGGKKKGEETLWIIQPK